MANYAHITRSTNPDAYSGGYKNVILTAPRVDFTAVQTPAGNTALGDALTIDTAHTFPVGKGFYSWVCKTHSVKLTGDTVGDDGAREIEWTTEFTILGDSASNQEQIQRTLNDDVIILLKDSDCVEGMYIQLGNDCVPPEFNVKFDGKTTKEGKKEYTVTAKCKKKYFYTATVSNATA